MIRLNFFLITILTCVSVFVEAQKSDLPYGGEHDVIVIHDVNKSKSEKEALLILSGFGDSKKGRKNQKAYFDTVAYDLYIPDFLSKESFNETYSNFKIFYAHHNLKEYKKIHVFVYIIGAWVLNTYINEAGKQNFKTIVYDRSPLQERAPKVVNEKIPLLGRIAVGKVLEDLTHVDYPPIDTTGIKIGIIVESKATSLIRKFKKKTMSYGEIDWKSPALNQPYHDLIYTRLNHDEMYVTFDEIGSDVMSFVRTGKFKSESRREPFDWDPFKKYKN